jgi:glucose-1-phosphate adenylyltransferase
VIISGGTVRRSILFPGVFVETGAVVEDSVIMNDVSIGSDATVRRAIIDKSVFVPPGTRIGVDPVRDSERFVRSPDGVVVIGKGEQVAP